MTEQNRRHIFQRVTLLLGDQKRLDSYLEKLKAKCLLFMYIVMAQAGDSSKQRLGLR